MPTIADEAYFSDFLYAIRETLEDVEKQIARMDIIYAVLDEEPSNGIAALRR